MSIFKRILIKQKLIFIIIIISSTATILACIAFIIYDQITFRNTMKNNLTMLAHIIGRNSTAALIFENENDAQETLEILLMAVENINFACIYDKNDKVFTKYRRQGSYIETLPPLPKDKGCYFRNNHLIVFNPIIIEGEQIGKVYLQSNLNELYSRIKNYGLVFIIVLLFSFFVSYLMALRLQEIISKPIRHLANKARDIFLKKDYSIRATKFSKDELGFLTDQFNLMLEEIQNHEIALKNTSNALQIELYERKQAEIKIKNSLKEKEILIKEIHHRVKNNLQVISSLLFLQSRKTNNKLTHELLLKSQDRIRSMALIHEMLYQTDKNIMYIDFSNYIKGLITHLFDSYEINRNKIDTKLIIDNVSLNINKAIPCGLIINELISNSLKHAFPKDSNGKISITMTSTKQKEITLIVQDNGKGIPKDIQWEKTSSLGLQLVRTLSKQLNGTIKLQKNKGTKFLINFNK